MAVALWYVLMSKVNGLQHDLKMQLRLPAGLRVPAAVGDFMILDAIRESNGCAVAVRRIPDPGVDAPGCFERRIVSWAGSCYMCGGSGTSFSESGWIQPDERVIIYNCGASQKYPDAMRTPLRHIDINNPIDWDHFDAD